MCNIFNSKKVNPGISIYFQYKLRKVSYVLTFDIFTIVIILTLNILNK